jgi:ribosomal protein S18 acetylase RimI-like enzyme
MEIHIQKEEIGDDTFITLCDHETKYGYIQYYVDQHEVHILYIFVEPEYRGRKYGERLMNEMYKDVISKMRSRNITQVQFHLDDMSDRYGIKGNLYKKMGFEYCEIGKKGPCGPEMTQWLQL